MNRATARVVNGVIGLTMLVMFTVAIVAGQARANLGVDERTLADVEQSDRHR